MSIRKLWLKRRRKYEVSGGKNSFAYSQWQKRYLRRSYEIESRMTGTKVDIVVPVYNAEKSLPAFFESVQKTNIQFRVILIDDASDSSSVSQLRFAPCLPPSPLGKAFGIIALGKAGGATPPLQTKHQTSHKPVGVGASTTRL